MGDDMDKLVDQAVEAEKLHALRRYRLNPVSLVPNAAAGSNQGWIGLRKLWPACAALALLSFALFLVLRHGGEDSVAGISPRTMERALSAAGTVPQEPSAGAENAGSDLSWTVQRVLCRAQLLQYSRQDLGAVVSQALANMRIQDRPATPSKGGHSPGLDQRILQLASSKAVERVLSSLQR